MRVFGIVVLTIVGFVMLAALAVVLGWFGQATDVAGKEFGPQKLFERYEWFKDAAAQLDKKRADITVYESRFRALDESYAGEPRAKWARDDREQYNIWKSEVAGIKASYNQLAAEYNAGMVKINWRYTNVGDLPPGSTEPLPREFKPYITE